MWKQKAFPSEPCYFKSSPNLFNISRHFSSKPLWLVNHDFHSISLIEENKKQTFTDLYFMTFFFKLSVFSCLGCVTVVVWSFPRWPTQWEGSVCAAWKRLCFWGQSSMLPDSIPVNQFISGQTHTYVYMLRTHTFPEFSVSVKPTWL